MSGLCRHRRLIASDLRYACAMVPFDPNPFPLTSADESNSWTSQPVSEQFDRANRPLLQPNEAAPDDYYQNNFIEVFDFVLTHHQSLLPTELARALNQFLLADDDAQRLFARLLTRKGPIFFDHTLDYREVSNAHKALDNLADRRLILRCGPVPADGLLSQLKKDDLLTLFSSSGPNQRAAPKDTVKNWILGRYSDSRVCCMVAKYQPWCTVTEPSHWRLVQLLYFGSSGKDWSARIRRDLGHIRYESVELTKSRFPDRDSLLSYLDERELQRRIYRLDEHPKLLPGLITAFNEPPNSPVAMRLRQRNLLRLGKWCERQQAWDDALRVFRNATIPPARERQVRILHKQGELERSQRLLADIAAQPLSATEHIFSQRFGRRGQGFQPPLTTWPIEETPEDVERYVLEALTGQGGWGVHSENTLVKTLTGLMYWEAVFAPELGAFTNPFQMGPHDLMEHEFAAQRSQLLAQIEAQTDSELTEHLLAISQTKCGIANPLVNWRMLEAIPVQQWLDALPLHWIRQLSHFLIRNLADYRKGFPDLFVVHPDGTPELVEVKGPSDQLQPQQRAWFEVLAKLDIRARVIKLKR